MFRYDPVSSPQNRPVPIPHAEDGRAALTKRHHHHASAASAAKAVKVLGSVVRRIGIEVPRFVSKSGVHRVLAVRRRYCCSVNQGASRRRSGVMSGSGAISRIEDCGPACSRAHSDLPTGIIGIVNCHRRALRAWRWSRYSGVNCYQGRFNLQETGLPSMLCDRKC